jgi:hypothetical protein
MPEIAYQSDPVEPAGSQAAPGDKTGAPGRLFATLKNEFTKDKEHWADWREGAEEDYGFVAGHQWSDEDRRQLEENLKRIAPVLNRIDPLVRSVSGEQINSGMETRYIPREMGDAEANEALSSVADWFRDQCDAGDEESDAFWDAIVCGVGCTDTRLDMDDDPEEPRPVVERIDPLEVFPDRDARKRNYADKKRVWRVREMPLGEAREMFPDAAPSDLDAGWARLDDGSKPTDREEAREYRRDSDARFESDETMVTIVQCQYVVREPYYKVAIPAELRDALQDVRVDGGFARLSVDEYNAIAPKIEAALGIKLMAVKLRRKRYKQCFLGRTILKEGDAPCKTDFSFHFITGFRDRNKGTFYGLVRGMKDPQRLANKALSNIIHMYTSSAKGGVMAEKDVAEDQRTFEESWAKNDAVTWVENGAITAGRIRDKPTAPLPQAPAALLEFAVSSIRDTQGINLEMLGMREGDQPASLEFQRRQAGITILAILFGSMRRYRRAQGGVMLCYIQDYLPGDMLVKIIGDGKTGGEQPQGEPGMPGFVPGRSPLPEGKEGYVPLNAVRALKDASLTYDIIVDEGPSSPNQKERVWGLIGPRFWDLPQEIQLVLLDYSPFPASVVAAVKDAAAKSAEGPQAEMQKKMEQLGAMLAEAQVLLTQAQAQKAQADAQESMADARLKASQVGQPVGRDGVTDRGPQTMLKAAELQQRGDIERKKIAARMQSDRERNASNERIAASRDAAALQREAAGKALDAVLKPAPQAKPVMPGRGTP